jgi:thioredoxin-related protein
MITISNTANGRDKKTKRTTNKFEEHSLIVKSSCRLDDNALRALNDPNAICSAMSRINKIAKREGIRLSKADLLALSIATEALIYAYNTGYERERAINARKDWFLEGLTKDANIIIKRYEKKGDKQANAVKRQTAIAVLTRFNGYLISALTQFKRRLTALLTTFIVSAFSAIASIALAALSFIAPIALAFTIASPIPLNAETYTDLDSAIAATIVRQKPMMVVVMQTTCPYCKQFYDQTLNAEGVMKRLSLEFVIYVSYLDKGGVFPTDFEWTGTVPTTYFVSPNGELIGQPLVGVVPLDQFIPYVSQVLEYFYQSREFALREGFGR